MKLLVVVDMQNDFITGSLGTPEAVKIVDRVAEIMENFPGKVICTRDTHGENYLETSEGKKLPVKHCIRGTEGHELCPKVSAAAEACGAQLLDKTTFGSRDLPRLVEELVSWRRVGIHRTGRTLYGYLCDFQCPSAEGIFPGDADSGGRFCLCGRHAGEP